MKISCSKDALLNGLQSVQSIVSTKGALPILLNVLIETEDESVSLSTTDLEIGIKSRVEAKIKKKGGTTLPAKRLFGIVRDFPGDIIELDITENNIATITSKKDNFRIMGLSKDDFPKIPVFKDSGTITVKKSVIKDLIKKTAYAVSQEETRYTLNGIYLIVKDGYMTMVATDGRRLALASAVTSDDGENRDGVIVPSKAINEIMRMLSGEGDIKIKISENQIMFEFDNIILVSKLIEGRFPDYEQVIPKKSKQQVKISREEMLAVIKRAALITSDKSKSVKLTFSKGLLLVESNAPDVGEYKGEIPLNYKEEEIKMAFNPDFLTDVLKSMEEEEIEFEFNDSLNPGVVKSGNNFIYVIMPMRIS
ncbi:MAG: DNA polymerase III subunit beta [Candidatus Aureabacteria bacterium]|nr:DNA polymerase III subunit beta [Candidatus Auribacterota bacterium]